SYFRLQMLALWASIRMEDDPHGAIAALDSAIRGQAALRSADRLIPLYRQRARAWRKLGHAGHERADLDTLLAISERVRDATPALAARTAMADSVWSEVNRLVMLAVAAGQPDQALRYLERGREPFSRLPSASRRGVFRVPPGQTALDLTLIGDTLLAWTVRGGRATLTRSTVHGASLRALIHETDAALARGDTGAAVDRRLEQLHGFLVRPVLGQLAAANSALLIVADGDIASAPFAALRDPASGRYLMEERILRFAPALPTTARADAARTAARTLVVADPTLDHGTDGGLPTLPGARAEAATVLRLYPDAVLLQGGAATRPAVVHALSSAEMVHYAGHAVFIEDRPATSYLALAPGPSGGSGHLTAAELSTLDLGGVRLIVLSACRVNASTSGRSGGFAGLAGALLYAGAGSVLGSQWQVDDQRTRTLMRAFQSAYRESGDGARSLRSAQLAMRWAGDPALRSPSAWAGFRLSTR
ncbi:MAG TPA: CHAT domain-containing protein, partial [Longimicrobiaceae bacterium]|nr:CHAT domain-containing protein [Longimicrobiaceae bacterium]